MQYPYSTNSDLVIGVDAGGSKTLALAADIDGNIRGRGLGGPANYQSIGTEAAFAAIASAIAAGLRDAGADPRSSGSHGPDAPKSGAQTLRAICLGMAGVDRPEDRALVLRWAQEAFPGVPLRLVNDALIVLAAGTPEGWGLALISGTGSIAYGRDAAGRFARAGGWGYLMGDEGSGYSIGIAALRATARAHDGRGPQTLLLEALLRHWELTEPMRLVRKVYGDLSRADIAKLVPVVEQAADAGDAVAAQILAEAGRELALAGQAVARRLEFSGPTPCALTGGVLVRTPRVRDAFVQSVQSAGLQLDPLNVVEEPAFGAVRLALEMAGTEAPRHAGA